MGAILNLISGLIKNLKMKIKQLALLLFILCFSSISGQVVLNKKQKELLKKIPQEKVFVHYNSNFLISGERLFYKVYCLNNKTNKLSALSKISYVEIINQNKEIVLKQKIRLEDGTGFGDFFINSSIKTGNYKVIAYTQWMKNKNTFFQDDLYIYNAFTNPPKTVKSTEKKNKRLNLKSYSKRQKVSVSISNELKKGRNFSISVKKINPKLFSQKLTSKNFINTGFRSIKSNSNELFHIPEFRGELLSGIVKSKNNSNIENLKIGLSSINKNGKAMMSSTNLNGVFHFNLTNSIEKENLYIFLDVKKPSDYTVTLLKTQSLNYNNLKFKEIVTTKEINTLIKNRSIYMQIENAYNSVKSDTLNKTINQFQRYQQVPLTFVLDDYKRFNTMKETIIEVVKSCWLENKNETYTFYVRDENLVNNRLFKPLVMVDGHIVSNHNELANFHPRKIKTIHVFRKKYILNSKQYHGIINVETFNLSFKPNEANLFKVNKIDLSKEKTYYQENYSSNKNTRIPDYRTQLYWNPVIKSKEITFYTSDVTGVFEINIEGITNKGKPVSIKKWIEVK